MDGVVEAVHASPRHGVGKDAALSIRLIAGLGVEGDVHAGATVMHRSRRRWTPQAPNLRQVHLLSAELHEELRSSGFAVAAGSMGENVTTRGVSLLDLPAGARLRLGQVAVVEVTGLRNPCRQLDGIQEGLMAAVLDRTEAGEVIRKAGVMAVVVVGGVVRAGDPIEVVLPALPHTPLRPV